MPTPEENATHYLLQYALQPDAASETATQQLATASVFAELAKANQQRIANLPTLLNSQLPAPAHDTLQRQLFDPDTGQLTPEIRDALTFGPDTNQ